MSKKVGIFADLHCGHLAGLAPSAYFVSAGTPKGKKILTLQQDTWRIWKGMLKAVGPLDLAIWNGDLIDGRGEKSGGTELITVDRKEQVNMAVAIVGSVDAKAHIFTYGTAYHTGQLEDWENDIAGAYGGDIQSHQWADVNGLVFDVKHHIGGSTIPHGQHTAIARDRLWNLLWAEREEQPQGNVYIRSHVHYHQHCGGDGWLAMTTPALQAANTKYGARRCSSTVDWGFVTFDVTSKENWTWQLHTARLAAVKAKATKF